MLKRTQTKGIDKYTYTITVSPRLTTLRSKTQKERSEKGKKDRKKKPEKKENKVRKTNTPP
jgi:hypothetical protein